MAESSKGRRTEAGRSMSDRAEAAKAGKLLSRSATSQTRSARTSTRSASTGQFQSATAIRSASGSTNATDLQWRTAAVISLLGSQRALADLLDVSTSQPSRWQSGEEAPSPEHSRELLDLDHVLARASLLWAPSVVLSWLTGSNSFLDGARPIDVLRTRGSAEVIIALDAEMAGSYA